MTEERFIPVRYAELFPYKVTSGQREAILEWAWAHGWKGETLRGFHWTLRRETKEYYDLLKEESP